MDKKETFFRLALYTAMIMDWANFFKLLQHLQSFEVGWNTAIRLFGIIFVGALRSTAQIAISH